ncbi:MAG TPA: hypothetical protein VN457_01015 [Chlamydiales bacterium]|nr:hypothetical protein [Chlamydiales bacterium]
MKTSISTRTDASAEMPPTSLPPAHANAGPEPFNPKLYKLFNGACLAYGIYSTYFNPWSAAIGVGLNLICDRDEDFATDDEQKWTLQGVSLLFLSAVNRFGNFDYVSCAAIGSGFWGSSHIRRLSSKYFSRSGQAQAAVAPQS